MVAPIYWNSTRGPNRLRSSAVGPGLCSSKAQAALSEGHLTLGVSSHRESTIGAPIR